MISPYIYPNKIKLTKEGVKMFGIPEGPYTLNYPGRIYVIKEPSGIIRNGFTKDFLDNFRNYFIES